MCVFDSTIKTHTLHFFRWGAPGAVKDENKIGLILKEPVGELE